jgi:hypothetical protein
MRRRHFLFFVAAILGCLPVRAQQTSQSVEVFCGAELGYADTNWMRLYDVRLTATPGVKWFMGHDWLFAFQASIPLYCDGYTYNDLKYHFMRVNNVTIAKQLHFEEARQHLKLTAGLFGSERWGADVKWMMPLNDWLLLAAQGGLTNQWVLGCDLEGQSAAEFNGRWTATFQAGANVFLKQFNSELRLRGGRYYNEDYGLQFDLVNHFRHCSVDLFYQWRMGKRLASQVDTYTDRTNGGFKVIVMLPPYEKRKASMADPVEFRPASNFRLTNNVRSDGRSMKVYHTDPEENERELPVDVKWGLEAAGE